MEADLLDKDVLDKRAKRRELRKKIGEINSIGKRLIYLREKLNITARKVVQETRIPQSCYADREAGRRTDFYEELLVLSIFFNREWQLKYGRMKSYPLYKGKEIDRISLMWLMFESDPDGANYKDLVDSIEKEYRKRELCLINRQAELENRQAELEGQLDMFNGQPVTEKSILAPKEPAA